MERGRSETGMEAGGREGWRLEEEREGEEEREEEEVRWGEG